MGALLYILAVFKIFYVNINAFDSFFSGTILWKDQLFFNILVFRNYVYIETGNTKHFLKKYMTALTCWRLRWRWWWWRSVRWGRWWWRPIRRGWWWWCLRWWWWRRRSICGGRWWWRSVCRGRWRWCLCWGWIDTTWKLIKKLITYKYILNQQARLYEFNKMWRYSIPTKLSTYYIRLPSVWHD